MASRLEHRLSDGAAGAHTAIAAVLSAARLGYAGKLPLQAAETGDGLESVDTTITTPDNLGEALAELAADTALAAALGEEMVAQHLAVKGTEWRRFCEAVTDWELREYLPFL